MLDLARLLNRDLTAQSSCCRRMRGRRDGLRAVPSRDPRRKDHHAMFNRATASRSFGARKTGGVPVRPAIRRASTSSRAKAYWSLTWALIARVGVQITERATRALG